MLTLIITSLLAFGSPDDFAAPATLGGGNDVRFTGSPSARWTCAVCHDTEATGPNPITLTGLPSPYVPGTSYELELVTSATSERAAFALELDNRTGAHSGTLELAPALMGTAGEPYLCMARDPVVISTPGVAQAYSCAVKRWRMTWRAPATDEGSVTLYASVVDANADSRTTGDVTHSMVLGVPSPSTVNARATGCNSVPGVLVLIAVVLLARRRRGVLLALVLIFAGTAEAAKKAAKKKKAPVEKMPEVTAPVAPPPPVEVAQPPLETVEPVKPVVSAPPAEREIVAAIPDTSSLPGGLELDARVGYGLRSLALSSVSYATPFKASFGFPSVSLGVTLYPMRLLRSAALQGLHVQGSYTVGIVLQALPLGGALVIPSEGRVALGYTARIGALELSPRALYRVVVGGVERNALFDDGYFQSLGGELGLGLVFGSFSLQVTPRIGAVVDVGTQLVRGYGASRGGLTYGGSACVGWKFGSGVSLAASYQLTLTRTDFAGRGVRDFEALAINDVVNAGYLGLTFER